MQVQGQMILLVDDSKEDAMLIDRTLRKFSREDIKLAHRVSMAEAKSFLEMNQNDIQLVLLDLGLPDTADGHDSFDRMKDYAPDIPIVILTGNDDHDLALELIQEGAEDFINKSLLYDKPELLKKAVDFARCRHGHVEKIGKEALEEIEKKNQVISWMSGGYSMQK